jgi:hypothetical protein
MSIKSITYRREILIACDTFFEIFVIVYSTTNWWTIIIIGIIFIISSNTSWDWVIAII